MPNSFVFDPNRCTGCDACRLACTIENELAPASSWRRVETFNARHHPSLPHYHLSLACNHCAVPACMHACPALAYSRDGETGAVLLDGDKCIGCRYCSWACPFDAPVFDDESGVMTKCTFCNHRLLDHGKPACASHCPTGALDFGDLAPTELTQELDGFPRTELEPRIRILRLAAGRRVPEMVSPTAETAEVQRLADSRISLRSEWSLMLFSLLAASLVALVAATALAPGLLVNPLVYSGAAALTMALGAAHLGNKRRAWRAVLNVRRSWLSREIAVLSSFYALAAAYLALAPGNRALGGSIAAIGFVGLFCVDQIYSVLRTGGPGPGHSARTLWTGLLLAGVFAGEWRLAFVVAAGKLTLYVARKFSLAREARDWRPLASLARVGCLILACAVWIEMPARREWIALLTVVGELVDRGEFYDELQSASPAHSMAEALRAELQRTANSGI